jgi:hypothetical protein
MTAPAQSAEIKRPSPINPAEQKATPLYKDEQLAGIKTNIAINTSTATGEKHTPKTITPVGDNPVLAMVAAQNADVRAHSGNPAMLRIVPDTFKDDQRILPQALEVHFTNKSVFTTDGNEIAAQQNKRNEEKETFQDPRNHLQEEESFGGKLLHLFGLKKAA